MISRRVYGTVLGGMLAVISISARSETILLRNEYRTSDVEKSTDESVVTIVDNAEKQRRERDPFKSLIAVKKTGSTAPIDYPPGKRGLVIDQLRLMGIARAVDGDWIAVVDNNSRRSYFLRNGDRLFDGAVSEVLQDRVIFTESLAEMQGKSNSREVVKRMATE